VAFASAALVMVTLMFLLAFAIAFAQERVILAIRGQGVQIKRWGGWILMAVGFWFVVLAIFADFFSRIFPV
jgi:hypothetical protein